MGGGNCNNNPAPATPFGWWGYLCCCCCCFLIFLIIIFFLLIFAYYTWAKPVVAPAPMVQSYGYVAQTAYPQYTVTQQQLPPPSYVAIPPQQYATIAPAPVLPGAMALAATSTGTAIYQANTLNGGIVGSVGPPGCGQVVKRGQTSGADCFVCGCDVVSAFENCCPQQIEIQSANLGATKVDGCVRTGCRTEK